MNRLANERSLYLRHAAGQKIEWHPWSEEAFSAARKLNKPVFVSSGAAWCHWCHVMARESFEDEQTANLLNERFICVKLDRDERPDVDRRLQQAVAAMGGGSGWPLNVFLTPEKQPFFGGTYFPLEQRQRLPGFRDVLIAVSDFYGKKKDEAESYAESVLVALKPEPMDAEELRPEILDHAERAMLSSSDPSNGGFGTAPKFPMPGAVEFLLRRFAEGGHPDAGEAARKTLLRMAQGGFHDQLGGGFHRYSVDEAWIIPHFEKMTDDNAGLLKNYCDGYSLFSEERFKEAAEGITRFIREHLTDQAGGFYASQDADVTADDEGGYFTWTEQEMKDILTQEDYSVISRHLIHPRARMLHDPEKMALAVNHEPDTISRESGTSIDSAVRTIARAKALLLERRNRRTAPVIDTMIYTSLNGMMVASCFRASMILNHDGLRETAMKSLERILRDRVVDGTLFHAAGVPALLDDYAYLLDSLLSAYEATGDTGALEKAQAFMAQCNEKFLDKDEGGYFDTDNAVLGLRLKRIEDVPHPAPNAMVVLALLKLAFLTGNEEYAREAERSLRIFAGTAGTMGVHGGAYFCSLTAYYSRSTITIEASPESRLAQAAREAACRFHAFIKYGKDLKRVLACRNGVCFPPVSDPDALDAVLRNH